MTHGATARLFVAVELPAPVRGELARWARAAASSSRASGGRLRLLEPETLHVTLCFLGEQPTAAIDAIAAVVSSAGEEPLGELSLGAPLWLPERRPRALAVELHDAAEGALGRLRDAVARGLASVCAFAPERRRLRAHVTVARMRVGEDPRERGLPATPQLVFAPVAVGLYRSWLGPTEASYEVLASCSLLGPEIT